MSKNKIVLLAVIVIVMAGVAFYGGLKYGQSGTAKAAGAGNFSQRLASSTRGGSRSFGGMVAGQILSVDNNSLTISVQTGGSRIVFLSASTTVSKMADGTVKDLTVGSNVSVIGSANSDNSLNAQTIQIRPAGQSR